MSLLEYYLKQGISPVYYQAKSVAEHLERRQSLYDMLGLPGLLFRGRKVLEFAAGSGQNSLYVAAQMPERFMIVEPNPVALKQIGESYADFEFPHTAPEIVPKMLEDFASDELFDVVICENWLGSPEHEQALLPLILERVAPGGMLIMTAVSITGWLPNLVRYGLIRKLLLDRKMDYGEQAGVVTEALSSHLSTISGMTRSHEDWVKDNMLNPRYLDTGISMEMILEKANPLGFTVFGSSPAFISEWRWFKQLHGENLKTNENALACYDRVQHNFLDYTKTFPDRDREKNRELKKMCEALLATMSTSRQKFDQNCFDEMADILGSIGYNLQSVSEDLASAVGEATEILRSAEATPDAISSMKHFRQWFGRETVYFSLQRSSRSFA